VEVNEIFPKVVVQSLQQFLGPQRDLIFGGPQSGDSNIWGGGTTNCSQSNK